jgi:hypothetical protein
VQSTFQTKVNIGLDPFAPKEIYQAERPIARTRHQVFVGSRRCSDSGLDISSYQLKRCPARQT